MKHPDQFLTSIIAITCVLLTITFEKRAFAQQADLVTLSRTEPQKSQKQVVLTVGKTIRYKTHTSRSFQNARITGITDSTISFENKKTGVVTIPNKDLTALSIRGNRDKRAVGTTLIVLGAVGVLIGVFAEGISESHIGSGERDPGAIAAIIGGTAALVGGIVLKLPKEIDLTKSWKFTAGKSSETMAASVKKEYSGFGVGFGLGSGTANEGGGATLISIEPSYRIRPQVALGLKIEGVLPAGSSNLQGATFTLNGQYYLSAAKLRPFLGAGLGVYAFGDPQFGFYPRAGLAFGQFSLTADYNIISVTSTAPVFTGPTSSQITGQPVVYYTPVSYSVSNAVSKYLGIRISYMLGGRK